MIVITDTIGQLDQHVIESLLKTVPASQIVAIVRSPARVTGLSQQSITVRQADYSNEAALTAASQGIDRLLLISSNEMGQRTPQYRNVIDAVKAAYVGSVAHTSLLHADTSPLGLADEHVATEEILAESDIAYTPLHNDWYAENHLASTPVALEHGIFIGTAGEGRIASATRADYTAAATCVIGEGGRSDKTYELAGGASWTLNQLVAELAKQSDKKMVYQNLSEANFATVLKGVGLPAELADTLADSDAGASKGGLFDDSHTLSRLIGHPTTSLVDSVKGIV